QIVHECRDFPRIGAHAYAQIANLILRQLGIELELRNRRCAEIDETGRAWAADAAERRLLIGELRVGGSDVLERERREAVAARCKLPQIARGECRLELR